MIVEYAFGSQGLQGFRSPLEDVLLGLGQDRACLSTIQRILLIGRNSHVWLDGTFAAIPRVSVVVLYSKGILLRLESHLGFSAQVSGRALDGLTTQASLFVREEFDHLMCYRDGCFHSWQKLSHVPTSMQLEPRFPRI